MSEYICSFKNLSLICNPCFLDETKFSYTKYNDIDKVGGELLAEGKGGRIEFGARALGNRSILSDSSRLDNLRRINMIIKKRDFWMPFTPTILHERRNEYIINPKDIRLHI